MTAETLILAATRSAVAKMAGDLLGEQPVLGLHAEAAVVDDKRHTERGLLGRDDGDVRLRQPAVGHVVSDDVARLVVGPTAGNGQAGPGAGEEAPQDLD